MNRRGKRLAFTVAATGLVVLLVLAIVHRKTVLEHVEAWHFQLTRETRTIEDAVSSPRFEAVVTEVSPSGDVTYATPMGKFLWAVWRNLLRDPVIVAVEDLSKICDYPVETKFEKGPLDTFPQLAREILAANGFRVLEQRFPRRAYVVIRDEGRIAPIIIQEQSFPSKGDSAPLRRSAEEHAE